MTRARMRKKNEIISRSILDSSSRFTQHGTMQFSSWRYAVFVVAATPDFFDCFQRPMSLGSPVCRLEQNKVVQRAEVGVRKRGES